ncbi:MAG: T9SS type A sorting domain-containing protein [Bacteroidales bacterium]|nr:T9SS type A sorting domain-containing protein [Bacteroidales bacterium]
MRKIIINILLIFIISFINLTTLNAQNCLIDVPSGVYNACPGNPTYLEFTIEGGVTVGPTYEYYYTINGAGPYMLVGSNPYTISITQAGTYELTACNDLGSGLPIGINTGYNTETITALPIPAVSFTIDGKPHTDLDFNFCENGTVVTLVGNNPTNNVFYGAGVTGNKFDPTTVVGSTTITYTHTDANGCVNSVNSETVTVNAIPNVSIVNEPYTITCAIQFLNLLATVDVGSSVLWTGPGNINNSTTFNPTVDMAGIYTITATSANECKNTDDVIVTENTTVPSLFIQAIDDEKITCNQPIVTLNSFSATPVVQYSWTTLIFGATILNPNTPTPYVNKTGDYTVKVTDTTNGCETINTTTVNEDFTTPIINIAAIAQQITCSNASIDLDASGSFNATNYTWQASLGGHILFNSLTSQPTVDEAGRYTVTAEHITTGCTANHFVDITQDNSVPVIDIFNSSPETIDCNNPTVLLSADATALSTKTIAWTTPDGNFIAGTNSSSPTIDQSGTYAVTITNTTNNCSTARSVTVTENIVLPYVSAGDQQDLCIDTTVFDANIPVTGTGTWKIINGAATISNINDPNAFVTNIGEGNNRFVWTMVGINGCSHSDTVLITYNPVNSNAGNNQVVCEESIVLAGSDVPIGGIGSWSVITGVANFSDRNSPTPIASGFAPGTNILKWSVTKGGCTDYDTIIVDNQRPTQANAGIDLSICTDSTILDANNPIIGEGAWTVILGAVTFENDNLFNTKLSGLSQGENILKWTISNGICSISDQVTVVNNQINVNAGVDMVLCADNTNLEGNNPIVGEGFWTVIAGAAYFENYNLCNTKVSGLAQGMNVLAWNISNNNCISSDAVKITNDLPTEANAGKDTTVTIDFITLQGNIPIVGIGAWSLLSGSCIIDNLLLNNASVSSLGLGENIFRWTVTKNSCFSTDEVIITKTDLQLSHAGVDQTLCSDVTFLDGNEPISGYGEWSVVLGSAIFADNGDPATEVTGLAKGENILRWTILNGIYSISDEVTVTNNLPELSIDIPDDLTCTNTTVMLHANAENVSYNWTYNSPANIIGLDTIANPIVNQPGTYILTVTDTIKACTNTESVTVLQGEVLNPGICMLSVYSLNHNVIIWNQMNDLVYDSIFIYKETSEANSYAKIGSQSAKDLSLYEDKESNSAQNSSRYKISILDSCGLETTLSEYHKTLHLTISLGLNGERNLIWDAYEGFEYSTFNIYRGTNNRDLVMIAEQASNTFTYTDIDHAGGKNYYQIEIVNPNPCNVDNLKSAISYYESTKSNIVSTEEGTSIFNLKMESIFIYPNPANNKLYIKSEIFTEDIFVSILTIDGKLIKTEENINSNTEIDISNLNIGMYILRLNFHDNLIHKKFIKQ